MTPNDITTVLALRTATTENVVSERELQDWGVNVESLTRALNADVKGWVYAQAGTVVGYAMADSGSAELLVLAVLPSHENKGIGAKLLQQAQDYLIREGHHKLWLKTAPNTSFRAYNFYQRRGWKPTGKVEDGDEIFVLVI